MCLNAHRPRRRTLHAVAPDKACVLTTSVSHFTTKQSSHAKNRIPTLITMRDFAGTAWAHKSVSGIASQNQPH
jgi:hypothetical protein